MLTQHEGSAPAPGPAPTPAAVSGTSQKLPQLLRKRLRQLLRVTRVLAICLAVAASALAIWWLTSLNGLPDIGDPFDVAAFRALRIPDDQNAFTFLRRADQKLTPLPVLPRAVDLSAPTVSWSKADPKLRAWVEANRQALELFQQGAEQSDAIPDLAGDPLNFWNNSLNPNPLNILALLEGSRRQESGDTAGAWDCYRAVLRTTAHVSRRGRESQFRVDFACGWLRQRLVTWAADPRTTIPQLQGALGEVLETEPGPEWDSFALKMGYLEIMRSLDRPMNRYDQQEVEGVRTYRLGDLELPPDAIGYGEAARRFLLREPERSRRVVRLLCAHWLEHVETHDPRRRKPAVRAVLTASKPVNVALYPVSPDATAGARALPPQELANWLITTNDARLRILATNSYLPWSPANHRLYRKAYRELVIMLATEIHHRERGSLPPSEEALVGTYLKSLPDDGSADLADERTPTVE
jgi:hypothetical protein